MASRNRLGGAAGAEKRSARAAPAAPPWLYGRDLRMLVADEDPSAGATVQAVLDAGVTATVCRDGAEALWQAGRVEPSVVILSATLPVVAAADVAAVLARCDRVGLTVLVGVGRGQADRVAPVLAAGAHGVVSRPYECRELRTVLRAQLSDQELRRHPTGVIAVGSLELDGPAFEARAGGRPLRLGLREFELLRLLMLHAGEVVSHDDIRDQIWAARGQSVSSNTIAVHIRHLRALVGEAAEIRSFRGLGYRLTAAGDRVRVRPLTARAVAGQEPPA